jgi:subtilisin family serine protease
VVAVLDTGVEPCHPLLRGHVAAGGLDLIDGDLEPWESRDGIDQDADGDLDEAAGHGTFVASIVALVAPRARILPYRVLDDDGGGTAYHVALALVDAIDREVDVINLSLTYRRRSTVVDLLLEEAAARGIVVVAAAGNDGSATLPFPAVDSQVLAVGSLNVDATGLAAFSNRGAGDLVAAPGRDVYGALDGGAFGTSTGTSMATPFVAGGAAMIRSLDPELSPELVRRLLATSGFPLVNDLGPTMGLDLGHALAILTP